MVLNLLQCLLLLMKRVKKMINHVMKVLIIVIVLLLLALIIIMLCKYWGKNISKSIELQHVLIVDIDEPEKHKKEVIVNDLVREATVKTKGKKSILIFPTKKWWQLTSKSYVSDEIKNRIDTPGFRSFLSSRYPDYSFGSIETIKDAIKLEGTKL